MVLPPKKIISESLTLVTAAMGLVAALAWNDAVKELINQFVPKGQNILSHFVYAAIVTILAVIINSRLLKMKEGIEQGENNQ